MLNPMFSLTLRLTASLFLFLGSCVTSCSVALEKPNIVLIFIDDMGYGDIGPFGNPVNRTPNLDRMAKAGNVLRQFYVSNTACTPSRSALMTGTYAHRIGMDGSVVFPGEKRGLNPNEITIAEMLKERGYATGCLGKWHLGDQKALLPLAQGFDEYFGIPYSNEIATTADLLPTLAKLVGATVPADRTIDGKDVLDILLGQPDAKSPHDVLYYETDGIRRGDWKLVRVRKQGKGVYSELYNLKTDLGERNDLAAKHPDIAGELEKLLTAHAQRIAADTRPAAFIEDAKPILTKPGELPRLRELVGMPDVLVGNPAPQPSAPGRPVRFDVTPVDYRANENDILIADFEGNDHGDWQVTGDAMGNGPSHAGTHRNRVTGYLGKGFINSYLDGDRKTGELIFPSFKIERNYINLLIGGGKHPGHVGVQLRVDDKTVREVTGFSLKDTKNREIMDWKSLDVSEFIGNQAVLRIVDRHSGGWGHTVVDHIFQSDKPMPSSMPKTLPTANRVTPRTVASPPAATSAGFAPPPKSGVILKDQWSTFPLYDQVGYGQSLRPQFHFTSRMGWLNDPNGMVYCDGEWHMLFQHHAKGNASGAKSWGNAVSTDLMHWKQLPHAINPYPNVKWKDGNAHAIWSGSAVVDELNTLGKQQGNVKTLFAIYTATHSGPDGKAAFFQGAAYSTDKGRTWTKINGGEPVIDHQEGMAGGQRDPRVFYYEPGKCYITIMMVGGPDRAVRLWKSTDLLNWEIIGDIPNKAAECIDMFHVAVDGDPNNRMWVISDAGSHYEVGKFDGTTWKGLGDSDNNKERLRFDYGDAWYAAQSFNQGPDGRAVHIGWLRSKQPGYRPFLEANMPFTQQMSVPVEITLRTTPDGIRMFRNPVKEIETLYTKTARFEDLPAKSVNAELSKLNLEFVDMSVEFVPSESFVIDIRGLEIHYDASAQEFVFTNTARVEGESAAWRKTGPYRDRGIRRIPSPTIDGRVKLRALVDRASLELFVNDGQAAARFVVVPDADNRRISIEGNADRKIVSLVVNELESIWSADRTSRNVCETGKGNQRVVILTVNGGMVGLQDGRRPSPGDGQNDYSRCRTSVQHVASVTSQSERATHADVTNSDLVEAIR